MPSLNVTGPSLNVTGYHSLVVHPANNKLVLGLVSFQGAGILQSLDGGNKWQLLANNQFDGQFLTSLAVHPTDQNTLYLSASSGAWKSGDGGQTWQPIGSLPVGGVWDLILAKFDSKTLYAAVVAKTGAQQAQNGVYKSTDGGTTWTLLTGLPSGAALRDARAEGIQNNNLPAVRIESGTAPGVVYISMLTVGANPNPQPALALHIQRFRTSDGGASWTALASSGIPGAAPSKRGGLEDRSWHLLLGVDPDPGKDGHVFVNDAYYLNESWDGGKTWSTADANVGFLSTKNNFDWVNITFDANGKALLTADQGVFRYDPASQTWTSLVGNLQVSEFYTIGLDPSTASAAYAVGQDLILAKFTGQTDWNAMEGGIGEYGQVIVDPTNSKQLFGFNPGGTNDYVMQSPDAGATWNATFTGNLLNKELGNYPLNKALAIDPSNSARLLVVADQVFETTNSGSSWSSISGVLSQNKNNPFIVAIGIAPSDGNTVYASTQDGHLWVTQNDGPPWNQYDRGLSGVVVELRIDPATPDHLFAITSNFSANTSNFANSRAAVWHLPSLGLPFGSGWVNITGSIPNNLNINSIFVDWQPVTPTLFVGTDRGLYVSLDLGVTWTKWGPGLPNATINDVQGEVLAGGQLLLAVATFGRGAWEILLKACSLILNRNPIGQDEVEARRLLQPGSVGGLPIQDAFRVVVDGFTASQLGLTGTGSTLPNLPTGSPGTGIIITPSTPANTSESGDYGSEFQRFTFYYDINFPDDSAFSFAPQQTKDVTLSVTAGGVPASALLTLIKQPDPFLLHGDPPWLSIDLRLFVVRPKDTWFGVGMGAGASADPPDFIQQVTKALTKGQGTAGGQSFEDPNVLSPDEEKSKLYLQPNDENTVPVFNFALAKVHYIGLIGATNVRMFFRLRQTQVTYAPYDFPPGQEYRRAPSNPDGQPIALAGIENGEYVTVPCFALPRIDSTAVGMDEQTDSKVDGSGAVVGNIRTITADPGGKEVDAYFGCWIDINQPDLRLPVDVPPKQDGPFDKNDLNPNFRPVALKAALARNLHLCVIAEIDFDQTPIPLGKDPSNWDKLAQRNIAWSDSGSAQSVTTFDMRPTPVGLPASQPPDELVIDWNNIPPGSTAQIYLPAVPVETILSMADRMYTSHRLTRFDAHTLQCKTSGITYVPIPAATGINYAGLLTIDLPDGLHRGDIFNVFVRQITNQFGKLAAPPPARIAAEAIAAVREIEWRRVIGAFQLTIPVRSKHVLLPREERDLSVLRWIAEFIPHHSRWYPVFHRYVSQIGGRVFTFGGDPNQILPSPTGDGRRKHRRHEEPESEKRKAFTGKIAGLIFDRFGDFEGFILDTEDGDREFFNREKKMEELAQRVWRERLRITVWVQCDEPNRPASITIREPPAPFAG
jgi:hypothetical protein